MRLRHIEIFEAICRTGSLTSAAKALHISQPAASKLLANAESQLEFNLFHRIKGRLTPTREAVLLMPHVFKVNDKLAEIKRLAFSLKHDQNDHLRIGTNPAMGLGLLPKIIKGCLDKHVDLTFDLRTQHSHELLQSLMTHELDLMISFDPNDYPGIKTQIVGKTELVYVSKNPLGSSITLKDLTQSNYISLETRDPSGNIFQQALEEANLTLGMNIQVQTHYMAYSLVAAGCGDGVVDYISAKSMINPEQEVYICPFDPPLFLPISIKTRLTEPLSIAQLEFIELLEKSCANYLLSH